VTAVAETTAAPEPAKQVVLSKPSPLTPLTAPETQFRSMFDMAKTLVESGMIPKHINTPAKAIAIILTGREMGIGAMAALRSILMVEGKPTLAADLQLGRFHAAGGRSHFEELTETTAVLTLHAPWLIKPHTERFTIQDAQRASLSGKDVWKKYPKAMLRSRAITAGLKSIGFEPVAGVYDPEELEYVVTAAPEQVEVVGTAAAGARPAGVDADGVVTELVKSDITLDSLIPFGKYGPNSKEPKTVRQAGLVYFRKLTTGVAEDAKNTPWYRFATAARKLLEPALAPGQQPPGVQGETLPHPGESLDDMPAALTEDEPELQY
jgi:hypothetical protein